MGSNHAVNEELLENDYQYKKLHQAHLETKQEIKQEILHPAIDLSKVTFLKRKKLRLADEMLSIESAFI
jgi:hypothetical protein